MARRHRSILCWAAIALLGAALAAPESARGPALVLDIEGAIGPASTDYLRRALDEAAARELPLVVLRLDTPGGLDAAMRDMVQAILGSPVPVATYVAPAGARAASAGTYILLASHVAAAAPATSLGAATPVQLGMVPQAPEQPADGGAEPTGAEPDEASRPADSQTAMRRKAVNDAAAYLRGLAELRGRNGDWAERAVRLGVSLSATAALEQGVIDLVAADVPALLGAIDGRQVRLNESLVTLDTRELPIEARPPDWRHRLLSVIADPNLAYMLLLVGIYGLVIEFSNPGYFLPGVVGVISLLLSLFALQVLPINYAGLALMLVGIGFMVAEAVVPSFGALGLGGVVAFAAGSLMLVDEEGLSVSVPLVLATAATSAGFFIWVLGRLISLRRRPLVSGVEELLGGEAVASEDFVGDRGHVWIHGESWQARGTGIRKGQKVQVSAVDGLILEVGQAPTREE